MSIGPSRLTANAAAVLLEPTTQQFVDVLAGTTPVYSGLPVESRRALEQLQAASAGKPGAKIEDAVFPVGPTGMVPARLVRPARAAGVCPAIVYFHGGGWVAGSRNTHDRLARELAAGTGAAVVLIEYDRAPESGYPAILEQAYAATRHIVEAAASMRIDPLRLAVAGDGVGGNMAAAITLLAKQRRGPRIAFQVLFYPATDARFDTASYAAFADGPWLTRLGMERAWNAYLPDSTMRRQITAAPLNASPEQLADLPEALVIVAENDVLRDDGEAYARMLASAGVRVTSTRYNGTIHDFVMLNALADTPAARGAISQAIYALRTAFS
jgi:acetyl esterase